MLFAGVAGCRSTKDVTTITHSRDSVTTVQMRPVTIVAPADTVTGAYTLNYFTAKLKQAKPGAVVTAKKSTRLGVSYRIIKTVANPADSADLGFTVEAVAAAKDTTVNVRDTKTVVTDNTHTETVKTVEPSVWEQLKAGWGYGVFAFVLLLLLLLVRKVNE